MKTLLFTLEYPPHKGGVANYYQNLVKNWPNSSKIEVLTNFKKGKEVSDTSRVYRRKLLFSWVKPRWLLALWHFAKLIKQKKYSHVLIGQILPLGICAYFLSFLFNFKYTVIIHGMDWTWALNTKRKKFLTKKIIKKADKIICANSYVEKLVKTDLSKQNLDSKIKVINPGINLGKKKVDPTFQKSLITHYNLENNLLLLTVGRLVARKGVDKVLEALARVKDKNLNIKYLIAGSGEEEANLKNKINNLSLSKENVIFLGEVSDLEKWSLLNLCDIFIMPARQIQGDFEGFGIVFLEANLMGKPVIASCSGGVGDAVVHRSNGLLVKSSDPAEIKKAILELAQDKKLRQNLGEKGRKRVKNLFPWSKKIKELYYFLNT